MIQFVYVWNQYLWPLLITTQDSMQTIVTGIKKMLTTIKNLKGRRAKTAPAQRRVRLQVEHLEERELMTVGMNPLISYSLQQGNLYETVLGTTTPLDTQVKSFATASERQKLYNVNFALACHITV